MKIIIINDDLAISELWAEMLEDEGHETMVFGEIQEFLVAAHSDRIVSEETDLILLDRYFGFDYDFGCDQNKFNEVKKCVGDQTITVLFSKMHYDGDDANFLPPVKFDMIFNPLPADYKRLNFKLTTYRNSH